LPPELRTITLSSVLGGVRQVVHVPVAAPQQGPYPEAVSLLSSMRQAVAAGSVSSRDAAQQLMELLSQLDVQHGRPPFQHPLQQQQVLHKQPSLAAAAAAGPSRPRLPPGFGGAPLAPVPSRSGTGAGPSSNGGGASSASSSVLGAQDPVLPASALPLQAAAPAAAAAAQPVGLPPSLLRGSVVAPPVALTAGGVAARAIGRAPGPPGQRGSSSGGGAVGSSSRPGTPGATLQSVDSSSSLFSQSSSHGQSVWTESGLPGLDFGASNAHPGIPQSLLLLWNNAGSRSNTPGLAGAAKPPPPGFGAPLLNHAAGPGGEAAGGAAVAAPAGGLGGAPLAQAALPVLLQPIGSGAAAAGGARPAPPGYGGQQQQPQQQLGGLWDAQGGVGAAAAAGAQGMEGGSMLGLQQQQHTGFYQQW
jgi:hypothetical protein